MRPPRRQHQCRDRLDGLVQITDLRHQHGRRHALGTVLAVAVVAALVGAASGRVAWRAGLRATLIPHLLTDASGIRAARYRLGRPDAATQA